MTMTAVLVQHFVLVKLVLGPAVFTSPPVISRLVVSGLKKIATPIAMSVQTPVKNIGKYNDQSALGTNRL